jgi:hypothetical protein
MVTSRITDPPWYTTGTLDPVAISGPPAAGIKPIAKPTRGRKAGRAGAAEAEAANASAIAIAAAIAVQRLVRAHAIGPARYRAGAEAVASAHGHVTTRGAGGYAG